MEYKLVEGEYASKEVAQIEVTETKTEVVKTTVSVDNLQKTIAFLKQKKLDFCAKIDEEIALNQAMLAEAQPLAETANIKIKETPEIIIPIDNGATTTPIKK